MKKLFFLRPIFAGIGIICATLPITANAESVFVKYRGQVNLAPFQCEWITRSSFIQRLCYDSKEKYVIVSLKGTYYHHCEVPAGVVIAWRQAASMGRYYNAQLKERYDCRSLRMPSYSN